MKTAIIETEADLLYQDYIQRQEISISTASIAKQVARLIPSDKFIYTEKQWFITPYQGYAVVSMVDENPGNESLIAMLKNIRETLDQQCNKPQCIFLLPESSYHQTMANTLSGNNFIKLDEEISLPSLFPDLVLKAFQSIHLPLAPKTIQMRMTGVSIFGSCIALLGVFGSENDYMTVLGFRKQFYANRLMQQMGVRLTRPFIGHITLAYLGRPLAESESQNLSDTIARVNNTFFNEPCYFNISNTGLRYFPNLSEFIKRNNYPIYRFKIY